MNASGATLLHAFILAKLAFFNGLLNQGGIVTCLDSTTSEGYNSLTGANLFTAGQLMERPIMGRTPYLAYAWPGLPMILATGSWIGLAWAFGFALLINLLLFASLWWPELFVFWWPEPFASHVRTGLWLATAVFWVGAAWSSLRNLRNLDSVDDSDAECSFGLATELYLKADWFGAERMLVDLLRRNPRDVEAGLMLATLWRHTGRTDEASHQLDRLELLDGSRRWALEIHQERRHLKEAQRQSAVASEQQVAEMNRAA